MSPGRSRWPPIATSAALTAAASRPLFVGRADQPLIVTTRNPLAFAAELRFAAALAWTALAGGLLALVLSLF